MKYAGSMKTQEKLSRLKDEDYQAIFGVTKQTFDKMLEILKGAYEQQHLQGGRPLRSLSITDKLVIMLQYYREYRAMKHIAFDYNVSKSTVCESIQWVETVLVGSKEFALPSKRKLLQENTSPTVIIDVTEYEIKRPKKKQKDYYLGKKRGIH